MNSTPHGQDTQNAGVADEPFGDLIGGWADELRSAVVTDLPLVQVHTFAEIAATAAATTAAGAAATAAGTSAVATTGGKSVSSLFISTLAKFAASAAVVASVGAGGAIAGVLPDAMQIQAADIAEVVGIDLPRPDVTIEVDGAGEVVVEVVDGVLDIVKLDAASAWDAKVVGQTDTSAVVEFISDSATKTVTIATDSAGGVISDVQGSARSLPSNPGVGAEADTGATAGAETSGGEGAGESDTRLDGEISGSGSADGDTGSGGADADATLNFELRVDVDG